MNISICIVLNRLLCERTSEHFSSTILCSCIVQIFYLPKVLGLITPDGALLAGGFKSCIVQIKRIHFANITLPAATSSRKVFYYIDGFVIQDFFYIVQGRFTKIVAFAFSCTSSFVAFGNNLCRIMGVDANINYFNSRLSWYNSRHAIHKKVTVQCGSYFQGHFAEFNCNPVFASSNSSNSKFCCFFAVLGLVTILNIYG
mmetsp:Transcript_17800/g.21801  ORF Transcript_17800/g.21801 Transcript_17800/m.21801 type:complete len:200 (-) Transcript_17800:160-759(-)